MTRFAKDYYEIEYSPLARFFNYILRLHKFTRNFYEQLPLSYQKMLRFSAA